MKLLLSLTAVLVVVVVPSLYAAASENEVFPRPKRAFAAYRAPYFHPANFLTFPQPAPTYFRAAAPFPNYFAHDPLLTAATTTTAGTESSALPDVVQPPPPATATATTTTTGSEPAPVLHPAYFDHFDHLHPAASSATTTAAVHPGFPFLADEAYFNQLHDHYLHDHHHHHHSHFALEDPLHFLSYNHHHRR